MTPRATRSTTPHVFPGESGFRRPSITLPDNHFGVDVQYAKGHKLGLPDVAPDELRRLWDDLVRQVRDADLVLGTHAELPERRQAKAAARREGPPQPELDRGVPHPPG